MSALPTTDRAGVVIVDGGGYMLVVRNVSSGYWGWPKGRRMQGEQPIVAAARELAEETSVRVDLAAAVEVGAGAHRLYIINVTMRPSVQVDGVEINAYDWITPAELASLPLSLFTRRMITRVSNVVKKMSDTALDMSLNYSHVSSPVCAFADVVVLTSCGLHAMPAADSCAGREDPVCLRAGDLF